MIWAKVDTDDSNRRKGSIDELRGNCKAMLRAPSGLRFIPGGRSLVDAMNPLPE